MMIHFNPNVSSVAAKPNTQATGISKSQAKAVEGGDFGKTVKALEKYLEKVDDLQHSADVSVKDLLTGKTQDITSVVAAVAKADVSFKLLVGVRNKLIEAYRQTMNMPL